MLVNTYGKKINIDLGARADEAAATQFRLADTLYRERKYREAADAYLRGANQFPELDATARALGNLMMSYAQLDDTLMVRTLAAYIAERLSSKPDGATALLAAGKHYVDKNQVGLFTELYETYLRAYPRHERAGTILFYLATQRKKAGDEAGAAAYFQQIIDGYPADQYYPRALNQVAWSFYQAGNYEAAIGAFRKLIQETPPGPDRANAQFNLADALVRLNDYAQAAAELETLIGWIAPRGNAYATTPADQQKNREVLEKAAFLRAQCFARMSEPADQVPDFRDRSIRAFDMFVRNFPESALASSALNSKGTVLLELKRFDEATKTFDELSATFPESPEGKNALFSLARAAMEIKQFDQGVAAFRRMMENAQLYPPEDFVRLGQMMSEAGYSAEAITAFQEVQRKVARLAPAEQEAARPMIERSLFGIASSYYHAKQYAEAIQSVDELLTKYPQSGLFYDAKFLQGEAYREAGQLQNAVTALSDVFRFATDAALINRATMTLAEIQVKNNELAEALASYLRVALLTDRTKEEFRPVIENALYRSVDIASQLNRHQDVIDSCDEYMELFPRGQHIDFMRRLRGEALLKAAAGP
jgi:TolA-binding protein